MAEYCKECFKNKILTPQERAEITNEQIIVLSERGLCESCGELKYIVSYVLDEEFTDDESTGCKLLSYFLNQGD